MRPSPGTVIVLVAAGAVIWSWVTPRHQAPAARPKAAITQEMPSVTAADIQPVLVPVLADLRAADRTRREAWIAEGYSNDLQQLIDAGEYAFGANRLNAGAHAASTDGYAYLAAYGTRLGKGWQTGYAQLRGDLNALAADLGLPGTPDPGVPLSAKPDTTGPPVPVPVPAASSGGTTVTDTTSSSGAHSHSVKVKTDTGSVTHRTSVSKTGTVTNTTTTTTTGG